MQAEYLKLSVVYAALKSQRNEKEFNPDVISGMADLVLEVMDAMKGKGGDK
jgi:hypothetical protein